MMLAAHQNVQVRRLGLDLIIEFVEVRFPVAAHDHLGWGHLPGARARHLQSPHPPATLLVGHGLLVAGHGVARPRARPQLRPSRSQRNAIQPEGLETVQKQPPGIVLANHPQALGLLQRIVTQARRILRQQRHGFGRHAAGRLLLGRRHDGFPDAGFPTTHKPACSRCWWQSCGSSSGRAVPSGCAASVQSGGSNAYPPIGRPPFPAPPSRWPAGAQTPNWGPAVPLAALAGGGAPGGPVHRPTRLWATGTAAAAARPPPDPRWCPAAANWRPPATFPDGGLDPHRFPPTPARRRSAPASPASLGVRPARNTGTPDWAPANRGESKNATTR